jgi:hypothetical protein
MNERFIVGRMRPMGLAAMISFGGYFSCRPRMNGDATSRCADGQLIIDPSGCSSPLTLVIRIMRSHKIFPLHNCNIQMRDASAKKCHGNPPAFSVETLAFQTCRLAEFRLFPNRWLQQEKYALTMAFFCLFDSESAAETDIGVGRKVKQVTSCVFPLRNGRPAEIGPGRPCYLVCCRRVVTRIRPIRLHFRPIPCS